MASNQIAVQTVYLQRVLHIAIGLRSVDLDPPCMYETSVCVKSEHVFAQALY